MYVYVYIYNSCENIHIGKYRYIRAEHPKLARTEQIILDTFIDNYKCNAECTLSHQEKLKWLANIKMYKKKVENRRYILIARYEEKRETS